MLLIPQRPEQLKLKLEFPLEDTISIFYAAKAAKVTESTMRRWCEMGKVRANQTGKKWAVYRDPLYALIRSRDNTPRDQ